MKKIYLLTDQMEAGPVAQRIRARGYEPRCRGFESLLAHPDETPDTDQGYVR